MSDKKTTRIVIDNTDGEIKSITASEEVEVVVVDYGTDNYTQALASARGVEDLKVIPADLSEPVPEEGGVFEEFVSEVDKDFVEETFGYVQDQGRVNNYGRTALALYEKELVDDSGEE